jgi:hypothetical protein
MGLRTICTFLAFWLLLNPPSVTAQRTTSFSGTYVNARNESGTAQYTYYLDGEKPVMHGQFRFSATFEDSVRCNHHVFRSANGTYAHGRKHGKWNYEYRNLQVRVEKLEGLRASTRTDGIQGRTSLSFEQGTPSGSLSFAAERIENGRISGIHSQGTANLDGGRPVGEFKYDGHRNSRRISGQFDAQGNYDGEWSIHLTDSIGTRREQRVYRNGFLIGLKVTVNDSVIRDLTYADVVQKLERLAKGDTLSGYSIGPRAFGVAFDDGFTADSPFLTAQQVGNDVLTQAQQRLFGAASEPYAYSGLDTMRHGSTRRFIYTYTGEEEAALLRSALMLDTLKAISDRYLENPTLMMNRQKSDSLAFSYGWLMTLQTKLGQLRSAIEKLESDDFRYQDRANYYQDGIACATDVDSIRYDFDGEERIRAVRNEACITSGQDVILNIDRFLKVLKEHLNATAGFLEGELKLLTREQQLSDTEHRILALTDSVFIRYTGRIETNSDNGNGNADGLDGQASALHQAVFRNLMVQSRKRMMQDYSNLDRFNEKQEQGLQILALLSTLLEAHERLNVLNTMPAKLDEAFTTFEYNPYMDRHDIKVRKKKRIYEKGVLELWPHMVFRLQNEKDMVRFKQTLDETFNLFDRLIELSKLSDGETDRLERKLRSETDPERIKRTLEL